MMNNFSTIYSSNINNDGKINIDIVKEKNIKKSSNQKCGGTSFAGHQFRVSIAMATYNGARFIDRQLASIKKQTYQPFELVITDDCSTDNTLELVEQFASVVNFPVSIYKNDRRLGYKDNFLNAASYCKGDLVAFCDQDDIWDSSKLARQVAYFANQEILLVTHQYELIDEQDTPLGIVFPKLKKVRIYRNLTADPFFTFYGMTLVFRRSLMPENLLSLARPLDHSMPNTPVSHDQFIPFLASVLGKIVFINEPLVRYRVHSRNTCGPQPVHSIISRMLNITKNVEERSNYFRNTSFVLNSCAESLKNYMSLFPECYLSRINMAIIIYKKMANNYKTRSLIYNLSSSNIKRTIVFVTLIAKRGYRPKQKGGLGGRAMIRDMIVMICTLCSCAK